MNRVAERITQLSGEPNFNPEGMASRSHSEYQEGSSLVEMIKEDLLRHRFSIVRRLYRLVGGESKPVASEVMLLPSAL